MRVMSSKIDIFRSVNVLLLVAVIRFSKGLVVSQPIVMKLFTHINDNILHQEF